MRTGKELSGGVAAGAALALVLAGLGACGGGDGPVAQGGTVSAAVQLDSSVRHQVIVGWEAAAQMGQNHPSFALFRDTVVRLAVDDLGINRLRLEVRSGAETSHDWYADYRAGRLDEATWRCHRYAPTNDNADPRTIAPGGFRFTELDETIEHVVLPVAQRVAARGERLFLNVNYVAFSRQTCGGALLVHDDPDEYAEFALATLQHMRTKYGLEADTWEVILEPDNTNFWRGPQIGRAIVATAARLSASGFGHVRFIAPSTTNMSRAVTYFDEMVQVPGVLPQLAEFSYHRYGGVSPSTLRDIGDRATRHGVRTAMLEHIGSGHEDLHADLTTGRNSSWQQFTLAFYGTEDDGAHYYRVDVSNPAAPTVVAGSRTAYLRQYFRWVRRGATRIGASSTDDAVDPVAFVNVDGRYVVVAKTDGAAAFSIAGLPAGRYGVTYTTAVDRGKVAAPLTVDAGAVASVSIPAAGVITVYRQ